MILDLVTLPSTAHPRVGGENVCGLDALDVGGGSSPRRRGKLRYMIISKACNRLIPA